MERKFQTFPQLSCSSIIKSQIRLKFAVQEDAAHVGGMTLFGSGFGNYRQGIRVRMRYSPMEKGNE